MESRDVVEKYMEEKVSILQLYRWNRACLKIFLLQMKVSILQLYRWNTSDLGLCENTMPKFRDFPIKIKKTKNFQKSFYIYDYTDILKVCQENEVGKLDK